MNNTVCRCEEPQGCPGIVSPYEECPSKDLCHACLLPKVEEKCCERCEVERKTFGFPNWSCMNCPCHSKEKKCIGCDEETLFLGCPLHTEFPTGKRGWQERFDDKFSWFFDNQTSESLKGTTTPTDIKSFISQVREEAKEEERTALIAKIEGMSSKRAVRIGENKLAMQETGMSMEEIRLHNARAEGFETGWDEKNKQILASLQHEGKE